MFFGLPSTVPGSIQSVEKNEGPMLRSEGTTVKIGAATAQRRETPVQQLPQLQLLLQQRRPKLSFKKHSFF